MSELDQEGLDVDGDELVDAGGLSEVELDEILYAERVEGRGGREDVSTAFDVMDDLLHGDDKGAALIAYLEERGLIPAELDIEKRAGSGDDVVGISLDRFGKLTQECLDFAGMRVVDCFPGEVGEVDEMEA